MRLSFAALLNSNYLRTDAPSTPVASSFFSTTFVSLLCFLQLFNFIWFYVGMLFSAFMHLSPSHVFLRLKLDNAPRSSHLPVCSGVVCHERLQSTRAVYHLLTAAKPSVIQVPTVQLRQLRLPFAWRPWDWQRMRMRLTRQVEIRSMRFLICGPSPYAMVTVPVP